MRYRQLFLAVLCAGLCGSWPAGATTIVPAEFATMVNESHLIVRGTVSAVHSQVRGGNRTIESLITVVVADQMKGPAAAQIVFRVPGGQVGRYRRVMVGAPEFAEGDEVVLFLRGRPPIVPMPYGLSQGVYRVSRSGGQPVVTPLITPAAGRVVRGDPARRPLHVDAFARNVRALLEAR